MSDLWLRGRGSGSVSERQDLIEALESLIDFDGDDAQWRAMAIPVFSRTRLYLKENVSTREAGKKGGATALDARGREGFAEMGRKGGIVTKERYGYAHFKNLGLSGQAQKKKAKQ